MGAAEARQEADGDCADEGTGVEISQELKAVVLEIDDAVGKKLEVVLDQRGDLKSLQTLLDQKDDLIQKLNGMVQAKDGDIEDHRAAMQICCDRANKAVDRAETAERLVVERDYTIKQLNGQLALFAVGGRGTAP